MGATSRQGASAALAPARGWSIIVAILWHVDITLEARLQNYRVFATVFGLLWYMPMPLFFLAIGVSFSKLVRTDRIGLVSRSITEYLYLYGVWTLVYHVVFALAGRPLVEPGVVATLKRLVVPAPELWFVLWVTVCLFLCAVARRIPALLQIVVTLAAAQLAIGSGYKIHHMMVYNLFFIVLGIHFRDRILDIVAATTAWMLGALVALYAILATIGLSRSAFEIPLLPHVASLIGIVTLVSLLALTPQARTTRMLAFIGRHAFQIYILAPFWIVVDAEILSRAIPTVDEASAYLVPALTTVAVIVQCIASKVALQRIHPLFMAPRPLADRLVPLVSRIIQTMSPPAISARRRLGAQD